MSSGGGFGGWGAAPGTAPHPSHRSAFDVSPSSPPSVGSRLEGMVSSLRLEGAGGSATAAHHRPPPPPPARTRGRRSTRARSRPPGLLARPRTPVGRRAPRRGARII